MENVQSTKAKHPIGLQLANISTVIQSFDVYAVSSILILYFTASVAQGGIGLSVPVATSVLGLYVGLGYLSPLVGGWVTDKFLGLQKAIVLGAFIGGVGYLVLYFSKPVLSNLWVGLIIVIICSGLFKGNVSTLVGELYNRKENLSLKDTAYSLFYSATNIGGFLGPIVSGIVADKLFATYNASGEIIRHGYSKVFLIASILLFIECIIFIVLSPKWLKDVGKKPASKVAHKEKNQVKQPLTAVEKKRIGALVVIFIFVMIYWAAWYQTQSSFSLLAEKMVNTKIGGFDVPIPWLTSFNGIVCIVFAPIFAAMWVKLGKSKRGDLALGTKMGLGLILAGISFLVILAGISSLGGVTDGSVKMNILFMLLGYVFLTFGELCLSPVGMSAFNKFGPKRYASLTMGAWYLCVFFANLISGKLAGFTASLGFSQVFIIIAVVVIIAGLIIIALKGKVEKLLCLEELKKEAE